MEESVDRRAFLSRPGSGRCHFAQDGGRRRRFSPVLLCSARSSPHFNFFTVSEPCLSSLRYASQFLDPYPSNLELVLATPHNLPLLRSSVSRSCLPCLLPHPIFAITRRIIWAITGALLLVTTVRNDLPDMSFAISFDAIPGTSAVFNSGIHLVKAQPRYSIEFFRLAGFHSSIFALGVDGIQPSVTRHSSKG